MEERLQKIISNAGAASRRAAEALIRAGRVTVDGLPVTALGGKYDAALHEIAVDGTPIRRNERRFYILLHKPRGCLSTAYDDRGRRTVLDLLPHFPARLYPVGRLDADTEGLLIITNDGAMTQGLLHPRFEIDKVYRAEVTGNVTEDGLTALRNGILLDDGRTAPARLRVLHREGERTVVETIIHEGRKRQVRRMFAAIGCRVQRLCRVRFAMLTLDGVSCGSFRHLTSDEIHELKEIAGVMHSGEDSRRRRGSCGNDGGRCGGGTRGQCDPARKDAARRAQDDDHGKGAL